MNLDAKIFVAGHRGLVGSAIVQNLRERGYSKILTVDRVSLDLRDHMAVEMWFSRNRPEYVFNAAATVGGIRANDTMSGKFFYDNIMIETSLIHSSHMYGVRKFLYLGSVCIYPKYASTPIKEDALMTGKLEPTNEAYAVAKIAGIKMCEAYFKQYGMESICVMPVNLYGPGDNYDEETSHVIPGMIRKFDRNVNKVILWGDGSPYRQFMYSEDLADACVFLMNQPHVGQAEIYNVGTGEPDIRISELAAKISNLTGYQGKIVWDTSKPNGTFRRTLDTSKFDALGWKPSYTLDEGLKRTYEYYKLFQKDTQAGVLRHN